MIDKDTLYRITEYRSDRDVPETLHAETLAQAMEIQGYIESLVPIEDSPLDVLPPITLEAVVVSCLSKTLKEFATGIQDHDARFAGVLSTLRNGAFIRIDGDMDKYDVVHGYAPLKHMLQDEIERSQQLFTNLMKEPNTMILALGTTAREMEEDLKAEQEAETDILQYESINELLKDIPVIDEVGIPDSDQHTDH